MLRRRHIERQNEKLKQAVAVGPLTDRDLLLVGAALYWAEGAKSRSWRPKERLQFINSDPAVILVFERWLDLLDVPKENRGYRVAIHESADVAGALRFWSGVLALPTSGFRKTTLKRHNPKTTRHNTGDEYHGCLVVEVTKSRTAYRWMEGIWWAIAAAGTA